MSVHTNNPEIVMKNRIVHLKVKIKSLAAEAVIIRKEEKRADSTLRFSLRYHRIGVVRSAARESLLAYAAIRGKPYSQCEPPGSSEPKWDEIKKIARRFGACRDLSEPNTDWSSRLAAQDEALDAWLEDAIAWNRGKRVAMSA